jgi:lysophospholipase L1-like esterase
VQEYYRNRFPEDKIKCYNAGVAGGNVHESALRYLEKDLELFSPTHVVLMIGMNDVWRHLYMNPAEHCTAAKTQRNDRYFEGVALLAEKLYARGISMTFCTPTPFDDEMACETPAGKNLAMALTGYGHFCIGLAEKYGAGVVDFNSALTHFNREMQKKDPAFSLCNADRVHPSDGLGHTFMALVFLRAQGFTELPEPTVENYEKGLLELSLSEDNAKRHEMERCARALRNGVYFCAGDKWDAPLEERVALLEAFVEENKDSTTVNPYIYNCAKEYLVNVGEEERYKAELLALTDALYE